MAEISAEARQYVSDNLGHVAEYLLAGDGFRSAAGPMGEGLSAEWASIFEELAAAGYMCRSNSGRYWWTGSKPGRPEVGEPVNVRLGDLLPQVDQFAAASGMSRAAAIRELVSCGLVLTSEQDGPGDFGYAQASADHAAAIIPDRAPLHVLEFGCSTLGSAIDIVRQCTPAGRAVPSVREQGRCGYEVASSDHDFIERLADRVRAGGYRAIISQR